MVVGELLADGYDVVLHARNEARGADALAAVPRVSAVLTGDLASLVETRTLAVRQARLGRSTALSTPPGSERRAYRP